VRGTEGGRARGLDERGKSMKSLREEERLVFIARPKGGGGRGREGGRGGGVGEEGREGGDDWRDRGEGGGREGGRGRSDGQGAGGGGLAGLKHFVE